jgi:hypothetical protein
MASESIATVFEYDGLTGQTVQRQETEEEIAEKEIAKNEAETMQAQKEAKELAKTSALAKLAALGLTEDEIAAL